MVFPVVVVSEMEARGGQSRRRKGWSVVALPLLLSRLELSSELEKKVVMLQVPPKLKGKTRWWSSAVLLKERELSSVGF